MNNNIFRPGLALHGNLIAAEAAIDDALQFLRVYDNWNSVATWVYEFIQPDGSLIQIQKNFGEQYRVDIIGVGGEVVEELIPDTVYFGVYLGTTSSKVYQIHQDGTIPTLVRSIVLPLEDYSGFGIDSDSGVVSAPDEGQIIRLEAIGATQVFKNDVQIMDNVAIGLAAPSGYVLSGEGSILSSTGFFLEYVNTVSPFNYGYVKFDLNGTKLDEIITTQVSAGANNFNANNEVIIKSDQALLEVFKQEDASKLYTLIHTAVVRVERMTSAQRNFVAAGFLSTASQIGENPSIPDGITHIVIDNEGNERDRLYLTDIQIFGRTALLRDVMQASIFMENEDRFYLFYSKDSIGTFYNEYDYTMPALGEPNTTLGPPIRTVDITSITFVPSAGNVTIATAHNAAWYDPDIGE